MNKASKVKRYSERRKLKGKMREQGYTYRRLAQEMGTTENSLSNKLNGYFMFTDTEMEVLCSILDISPVEVWEYFFPAAPSNATNSATRSRRQGRQAKERGSGAAGGERRGGRRIIEFELAAKEVSQK
ncbi:MAG: DUF739 family protein [Clostridiales bacterium]|jgi:lambda repressor-like predicted transcriptional regulator|nr:DUF739 family protein [Clostridiales bacterium]